jgi:uncharacterized Zn-binding protein involved in type VI secretion
MGAGSHNVKIHNRQAWMANRISACLQHGSEIVGMASETVLINGSYAARVGDYLQGIGPPNRIMETLGADQVLIGTSAFGVEAPENLSAFCKDYCQLRKDWPSLTPAQREARYRQILAKQFATFGAPPPTTSTTAAQGTMASWDSNKWQVNVPPGTWNHTSPPWADATLHEVAHGQQTFMAMRTRNGSSGGQPVPQHVRDSAASQPVAPNSPAGRYGSLHANNEIDAPGLTNRSAIINNFAKDPMAYRLQPGGQGGAEAGNAASNCKC